MLLLVMELLRLMLLLAPAPAAAMGRLLRARRPRWSRRTCKQHMLVLVKAGSPSTTTHMQMDPERGPAVL